MEPMNLQLVINKVPFQLGEPITQQMIEDAGFHRLNVLTKLVEKIPRGQTWYQLSNCTLSCFGEEFVLYPCTDSYLNRDRRWDTAALLKFEHDRLFEISFQVLDGQYAANSFVDRFRQACVERFGPPLEDSRFQISWHSESETVVCALHPDLVNADFTWMLC